MKRSFPALLLMMAFVCLGGAQRVAAQNLQVLYDAERGCVTSTVEMFRADKFGSSYFFVDIDYAPKATGTYWEIMREVCLWQQTDFDWLSVHLEHNGGHNLEVGSFDNAWIAGLTYSGHSQDYTKTWSLSLSYRYTPDVVGANGESLVHNFELNGVWNLLFAEGWCEFCGFATLWREVRPWQGTKYAFLSEPQVWLNLNKLPGWQDVNLCVGGEIELSCNYLGKGFRALPAVGVKWVF